MAAGSRERIRWSGVDLDHPNAARVYDYYLGGTANYAVDRAFGERALAKYPFVRPAALANRMFLRRVVRYLVKRGVRQFIDIGSGVPTMDCTHQVAEQLTAQARVVYVDHEPVAVAHSEMLLARDGDPSRHAVVQADLRHPGQVWHKAAATGVIDPEKPLALLLIAVLHITQPGPDGTDLAPAAVAKYRELLSPGSYLAISHGTADGVPADRAREITAFGELYDTTPTPMIWRSRAEIGAFFGDLELVEPGATWSTLWHPEENGPAAPTVAFDHPNECGLWGGVAHKPRS
jgi:hypothetical protein